MSTSKEQSRCQMEQKKFLKIKHFKISRHSSVVKNKLTKLACIFENFIKLEDFDKPEANLKKANHFPKTKKIETKFCISVVGDYSLLLIVPMMGKVICASVRVSFDAEVCGLTGSQIWRFQIMLSANFYIFSILLNTSCL